jgi:hypothetical protein
VIGTAPLDGCTHASSLPVEDQREYAIPPCNCGGTDFALVGGDGGKYFAVRCKSCRKEYVFRVRGRKLTMLRQIN